MESYLQCLPIKIFKHKINAERYKNKIVKKGFNALIFKNETEYYVHVCNQLNENTKKALIKNLENYGFNVIK